MGRHHLLRKLAHALIVKMSNCGMVWGKEGEDKGC